MPRPKGSKNKPKDQTMPKTATADRSAEMQQFDQEASKGEVAIFQPPRIAHHPAVEERFGVDRGQWKVLVEAIYPAAKTADAIVMVLSYCKSRNLDPMKRPVHIVPMWDSQRGAYVETVWPGISELRTTASRTKGYAGCDVAEFGPTKKMTFQGRIKQKGEWINAEVKDLEFPEWCRITVYRIVDGQRCKFVGPKVSWLETYATQGNTELPNKMWQERPEGQLEKCAEAAALRRAFPEEIGNELTAEEMTGKPVHELVIVGDAEPTADATQRDAAPPRQAAQQQDDKQEEARDGTPPRRTPKADPKPDAAPPRQAAAKKEAPINTGPQRTTAPKTAAEEVKPHRVPGDGHTFESWAAKYTDLLKTSSDLAAAYKWIDENSKDYPDPKDAERRLPGPLTRLQKGKPSVYNEVRKATERVIETLREASAKAQKKPETPPNDEMGDQPPVDMDNPADFDQMTGAGSGDAGPIDYGKPADDNPETILKWIDGVLATAEAPEDVEYLWENVCQQYTVDFIPPDRDEAAGLVRKHEKRLEP